MEDKQITPAHRNKDFLKEEIHEYYACSLTGQMTYEKALITQKESTPCVIMSLT